MKKTMGEFILEIKEGEFTDSEIVVMLGENGECVPSSLPSHQLQPAALTFSRLSPCLQERGKPHLSGCWPGLSNPMEEVSLSHTVGE